MSGMRFIGGNGQLVATAVVASCPTAVLVVAQRYVAVGVTAVAAKDCPVVCVGTKPSGPRAAGRLGEGIPPLRSERGTC